MNRAHLVLLPLLAATAMAQSPTPMTTPRAHWVNQGQLTGTPTQRRDNFGAASNDRLYVFGGRDANANSTVHNALYSFDGAAWTLHTPDTAAAGFPAPRGGACVAWNFTTGKLVVYGGDTGTGPVGGPVVTTALLGDIWEWDPVTNAWTDMTPPAGSPAARRFAAMTWDPTTGGMLMFGGDTAISPVVCTNETWLWIGGVWTQLLPATVPPVMRQHSMCTRPEFQDIIMLGGIDSSVTPSTIRLGVWQWTGGDWVNLPTNGTIPHAVNANQAVYDQARQRIVLQGGQGLQTLDPTTYPLYTGSPSSWCSEWDSYTHQWRLYGGATATTNDAVIGRISRYFGGYLPNVGRVCKWGGQNSSGTGTITGTCWYEATPLASTAVVGAGCASSVGTMALTADNAPWTTRTFQATATGLAPLGLPLRVLGFQSPAVPISSLHPAGGAGCDLLARTDAVDFLFGSGGTATVGFAIPDLAALAGAVLYAQVVQLEFDALGNLVLVSSSNGLALTIGAM